VWFKQRKTMLCLLSASLSALVITIAHRFVGGAVGVISGLVVAGLLHAVCWYWWTHYRSRVRRDSRLTHTTDATMIPDTLAAEVLERAARLQMQQSQNYTVTELMLAGSEVNISSEYIQQALRQIQDEQQQQQIRQLRLQQIRKQSLTFGCSAIVALLIWIGWVYNSLNHAAANVDAKWMQVENQLQRRADLIPKLMELTQTSVEQQNILAALTQAQKNYQNATTPAEKMQAIAQLDRSIDQLQEAINKNPQLRFRSLATNLQYEIAGTENRIFTERMRYNEAVQMYDQQVTSFPTMLVAHLFKFQPR